MSVMATSRRVTRAMRDAIKETISPANQGSANLGSERAASRHSLTEAGDVSQQFGQELYQRMNAYTGSIDDFGYPGNTADSWREQFSRKEGAFKAANNTGDRRKA